ncbi:MAG: leucine-rich repeat domain-containing protein [Bacteroidales bacterium]|nr:leucine-rich repeat domain-containing protein [Bacteroidales bacterium]
MAKKPDNRIASGSCGENLEWFLTGEKDNYMLTVSGTGDMKDYKWNDKTPWENYRSAITIIKINSGVASIGNQAFKDCSSLTSIIIPNSVNSIGRRHFPVAAV